MTKNLSAFIVQESVSVFDAAAAIAANNRQVVFVCKGMKLLASFNDGDLRRYILKAGDVSLSVRHAANYNPLSLGVNEVSDAQRLFKVNPYIRAIPIIDENSEIASLVFFEKENIRREAQLEIPVVIMAGGRGTRLAPFTDVLPKPLIPVGDKTITEHIMMQFQDYGCNDFSMIVNYKKELIKAYFSETSHKGSLRFIDEQEFQGTGGGLRLLKGRLSGTFFMTNCDILVEADYEDLLNQHRKSGALITMVCAFKKVSVPYGTVELDENGNPIRLVEKPEYPLLTNTGLYVIEPAFLDTIPANAFVHITQLIQQLIDDGQSVGVYPISGNQWSDMGQHDELENMITQLKIGK